MSRGREAGEERPVEPEPVEELRSSASRPGARRTERASPARRSKSEESAERLHRLEDMVNNLCVKSMDLSNQVYLLEKAVDKSAEQMSGRMQMVEAQMKDMTEQFASSQATGHHGVEGLRSQTVTTSEIRDSPYELGNARQTVSTSVAQTPAPAVGTGGETARDCQEPPRRAPFIERPEEPAELRSSALNAAATAAQRAMDIFVNLTRDAVSSAHGEEGQRRREEQTVTTSVPPTVSGSPLQREAVSAEDIARQPAIAAPAIAASAGVRALVPIDKKIIPKPTVYGGTVKEYVTWNEGF